jgi:hypothetical protein
MAQPQHQMPPRAFSPQSPNPTQQPSQPFALPPNKRPRLSPGPPSQPGSPYVTSPYAAIPVGPGTPSTAAVSPGYSSGIQLPYSTPYTNGHTNIGLNLPDARIATPTLATPQSPGFVGSPYGNAALAPVAMPGQQAQPAPGTMGPPPTKPTDRPAKEMDYDVTDSLAGTGIDIHAEEQYMADLMTTGDEQLLDARTGFSHHPPGGQASFYGAGPLNQPPQATNAQTQQQLAAQSAEKAWMEAASRLATTRSQEIQDPFLLVAILHRKAEKIAKEYGLGLRLDQSGAPQAMGRMKLPSDFPEPKVTVTQKVLSDATVVTTTGSWVPPESLLVDQLALMSIATKSRLKELIEDADIIATTRQTTSHGEVPEQWQIAAAPVNSGEVVQDTAQSARTGAESAVSPRTNPLKR